MTGAGRIFLFSRSGCVAGLGRLRPQLHAASRTAGLAASGRSAVHAVGRGQARRRRGADQADRRPRHVRRRFPAQGRGAGRDRFALRLFRHSAAARRHRDVIANAELAADPGALRPADHRSAAGRHASTASSCAGRRARRRSTRRRATRAAGVDPQQNYLPPTTGRSRPRRKPTRRQTYAPNIATIAPAGQPMSIHPQGVARRPTIFPTTPSCRRAAPAHARRLAARLTMRRRRHAALHAAGARSGARPNDHRRDHAGDLEAGGDLVLSDRVGARALGDRRRAAGGLALVRRRRSSRSSRSRPIPAAA